MSDPIQEWLAHRAVPPGLLAMGFRQPSGAVACQSFDPLCPVAGMENLLAGFAAQHTTLQAGGLVPHWCTWVFERGLVRYVERPDGWLMGVVAGVETQAQTALDLLAREFIALDLPR